MEKRPQLDYEADNVAYRTESVRLPARGGGSACSPARKPGPRALVQENIVMDVLAWSGACARPSSQSAAFDKADLDRKAEMLLYRLAQAELFPEEIQALKAGQPVHRESKLLPFRPFMHGGVIRVGGHLTTLLLNHIHRRTLHQGVEAGLTLMRQK